VICWVLGDCVLVHILDISPLIICQRIHFLDAEVMPIRGATERLSRNL
jgi:hypothetical protein